MVFGAGALRRGVFAVLAILSLCIALQTPSHAAGRPSKLDAVLLEPPVGLVRVIVSTTPGQTATVAARLRQRRRVVAKQYSLINAVAAELAADDLTALDADPSVTSVSIDAVVVSDAASNASSAAGPRTLLATLGLPLPGLTGKGVGVAVIDSGLQENGDFSAATFYDFTSERAGGPSDEYGHGTHVSGLIASKGSLSQGAYVGIAPKVRLVSLKVLDGQGYGSTSRVIEALEFATVNRAALGIDVINMSLGHPIFAPANTDPLVQAVEAAVDAGIVVVVSAGNVGKSLTTGLPGYAGILSPANAPSAITVGAVDTRDTTIRGDDAVTAYSSRGPTWYDAFPKPDIVAPGQDLVSDAAIGSTLYARLPDRQVAGVGGAARFLRLNGTSMSAAVTTGIVALMIEASRSAYGIAPPPRTIKEILAYTALAVSGADPLTQGHGAVNASGAVSLILAAGATGWPATGAPVPPLSPITVIGGETWTWGQAADWGDTVVWGSTTNDTAPTWAQTVVWGNVDWDTVVWGNADSIGWGDTVVWGSTVVWGNGHDFP